jgi:hypothetical protein
MLHPTVRDPGSQSKARLDVGDGHVSVALSPNKLLETADAFLEPSPQGVPCPAGIPLSVLQDTYLLRAQKSLPITLPIVIGSVADRKIP